MTVHYPNPASPPNAPGAPQGAEGPFGLPPAGEYVPPGGGGGDGYPPPPKKSSFGRGCLIALAVLFGVAVLCTCTGLGIFGYAYYSSPELRRVVEATGDIVTLAEEGMEDPGAKALVEAGCDEALALPLERFSEILGQVEPGTAAPEFGADAPEVVVICRVRAGDAPSCDELAPVFARAHTSDARPFALVVQTGLRGEQACANVYEPGGELMRPLDVGEQDVLPK